MVAPTRASAEDNPPLVWVRSDNTFFAYVEAGENLDVSFTKMRDSIGALGVTVTVTDPTGAPQSCTVGDTDPLGTDCTWTDLTSGTPGVWEIFFDAATPPTAGLLDWFEWTIDVQDAGGDIPGRLWTNRYSAAQISTIPADFSLYYVSEHGFQYEAELTNYNGVDSVFASDAAGNTLEGTCVSAYKSYDQGTPPGFPYGDNDQYDSPALESTGLCGDPYKIFFSQPAADLPTTATLPDGSIDWIKPAVVLPDLTSLVFDQDTATNRAGTFSVDVDNFTGQMVVQIDVNNDGDYTDAVDVELPLAISGGTATVDWDGLDGEGNPVPYSTELTARALISQAGEIHFVNGDVETRGGLQVTALNGPQAGSTTLYWDDTDLRTADRLCTTSQLDGTAGVDSTGGVHEWTCFLNANDGVNGSWGDVRSIDDWTYHSIAEELAIPLPGLPELEIEKTSTATTESRIGDTITYTVEITNNGPGDYTAANPARVQDDLSGVLDDATYNDDAVASTGTVSYAAPRLTWEGELASGDVVTLTYSVELTGAGDMNVENVAFQTVCAEGDPDCTPPPPVIEECETDGVDPVTGLPCDPVSFQLPKLSVTKVADTTEIPVVGETVTYTVTFENVGEAAFTATRPAVGLDDLSAVLDDATIDETTLAASPGTVSYAEPIITWTGPLAVGDVATVTYQVTYTGEGDSRLINVAFGPHCGEDDPDCGNPPPTPECDPADANGLDPVTGEPCGRVTIPAALLDVTKTVDPAKGTTVNVGDELTYTITFANSGTATADVDGWTDVMAGVLDDAEIVTDPTPSDPDLTVSPVTDGRFTVDGTVPAGGSYTVTYTVRVLPDDERGDNLLGNFVLEPGTIDPPTECLEADPLCTYNPVPEIVDAKSADPLSHTTVQPGQDITYTLTFSNTGEGPGTVAKVDDLNGVLDDADITVDPATSDPALTADLDEASGQLTISGTLAPDQTVTVTYTLRVKAADDLGDKVLANYLIEPGGTPPESCEDGDEDCTQHPVSAIGVIKSADPATGTEVEDGQELTYTLTFTNTGAAAGEVDHTDHMAGVLDDAEVTESPTASDPALTVLNGDDQYTVQGTLQAGQTVTVSYTVQVREWADQGDHVLGNFVTLTGQEPPAECVADSTLCTEHPVAEPPAPVVPGPAGSLPTTGVDGLTMLAMGGALLTLLGGALVLGTARRKKERQAAPPA